jgi:hypothetical protein
VFCQICLRNCTGIFLLLFTESLSLNINQSHVPSSSACGQSAGRIKHPQDERSKSSGSTTTAKHRIPRPRFAPFGISEKSERPKLSHSLMSINDISASRELDRKAMTDVRGGGDQTVVQNANGSATAACLP